MEITQESIQVPQQNTSCNESIQPELTQKNKKRKVSDVWNHYTKLNQGQTPKAICKNCQAALSAQTSSGTNHLWRHFKRCHNNQNNQDKSTSSSTRTNVNFNRINSLDDLQFQRKLLEILILNQCPFQIIQDKALQNLLSSSFKPHSQSIYEYTNLQQLCIHQFKSQKQSISQIIQDHQSELSISIEPWTSQRDTHFIKLSVHYIHPETWKLTKTTLAFKPILDPLHELELATCICEILQEWNIVQKCASITTEKSTTNDLAILRVKNFIKDQASSTEQLRPKPTQDFFFHITCTSFLINEIVNELVKNHQSIISKLRKIINFLTFTNLKKSIFEQLAETFGLLKINKTKNEIKSRSEIENEENKNKFKFKNIKIPSLDFPNRWDSTFFMISNSIHFKLVFDHLQFNDPHFPQDSLSLTDWNQLKNLNQTLEILYNATHWLSNSDSSPAASEVYVNMRRIEIELNNKITLEITDNNNNINNNNNLTIENYTKLNNNSLFFENLIKSYWNYYNNNNSNNKENNLKEFSEICSVFDPRMKLDYLKFSLFNQFGLNSNVIIDNLRSRIYTIYRGFYLGLIENRSSSTRGSKHDEIESIPVNPRTNTEETSGRNQDRMEGEAEGESNEITDEFENYLIHSNISLKTQNSTNENTKLNSLSNYNLHNNNSWITSELDLYLLEPPLRNPLNTIDFIHQFDLLEWWKSNQLRFPNLSKFVLILLAVPVSCVNPEFNFFFNKKNYTNSRQLNHFQSGLDDVEFLESLICNRDWIKFNQPSSASFTSNSTSTPTPTPTT